MQINERFWLLSTVARILWCIGILILFVGLFSGVLELLVVFQYLGTTGAEWVWAKEDLIKTALFAVFTFSGILIIAIAELIGVLFAIEKNTRT
jgi:hypothetical protein